MGEVYLSSSFVNSPSKIIYIRVIFLYSKNIVQFLYIAINFLWFSFFRMRALNKLDSFRVILVTNKTNNDPNEK